MYWLRKAFSTHFQAAEYCFPVTSGGMIPPVSKCSWVICIMWSMPTVGWSRWVDCRTVTLNLPSGHLLSHEGIACLAWYSTPTLRHLKISSNKIPNLTFFCMFYPMCHRLSSYIPCHGLLSSIKRLLFEDVRKTNPIQEVRTKSVH